MQLSLPKWIADVAVVVLIFTIGGYAARLEFGLNAINKDIEKIKTKQIQEMDKKIVAVETAISIHHGRDWSDKIAKNTLLRVEDLEQTIFGISKQFDQKMFNLGSNFDSTVQNLTDLQKRITAVDLWTKQGDAIIKRIRLEQFRALAVYTTAETENSYEIKINKQHRRGATLR